MSIYDSQTGKSDLAVDDLSIIKRGKTAQELFSSGNNFTPTEAQLAAMSSGITSADVEQITTNENNISSLQGKLTAHTAGGSNYDTINGIRVYVSSTAPTGDIPTGSLWIGG